MTLQSYFSGTLPLSNPFTFIFTFIADVLTTTGSTVVGEITSFDMDLYFVFDLIADTQIWIVFSEIITSDLYQVIDCGLTGDPVDATFT
jgi:hypothetical protein